MDIDRIRAIIAENDAENTPGVFAAVAQAASEASQETRQQYLDCLHDIRIPEPKNCAKCMAQTKERARRELQNEIRSLLHLKGWEE